MLGKPTGSPGSGQSQRHPGGRKGEQERAGERVGALTISRFVKEDGRELILYTRTGDERP